MITKDDFDNEHNADIYNCPEFTDRSKWVHLPCRARQQLYLEENGKIKALTVKACEGKKGVNESDK